VTATTTIVAPPPSAHRQTRRTSRSGRRRKAVACFSEEVGRNVRSTTDSGSGGQTAATSAAAGLRKPAPEIRNWVRLEDGRFQGEVYHREGISEGKVIATSQAQVLNREYIQTDTGAIYKLNPPMAAGAVGDEKSAGIEEDTGEEQGTSTQHIDQQQQELSGASEESYDPFKSLIRNLGATAPSSSSSSSPPPQSPSHLSPLSSPKATSTIEIYRDGVRADSLFPRHHSSSSSSSLIVEDEPVTYQSDSSQESQLGYSAPLKDDEPEEEREGQLLDNYDNERLSGISAQSMESDEGKEERDGVTTTSSGGRKEDAPQGRKDGFLRKLREIIGGRVILARQQQEEKDSRQQELDLETASERLATSRVDDNNLMVVERSDDHTIEMMNLESSSSSSSSSSSIDSAGKIREEGLQMEGVVAFAESQHSGHFIDNTGSTVDKLTVGTTVSAITPAETEKQEEEEEEEEEKVDGGVDANPLPSRMKVSRASDRLEQLGSNIGESSDRTHFKELMHRVREKQQRPKDGSENNGKRREGGERDLEAMTVLIPQRKIKRITDDGPPGIEMPAPRELEKEVDSPRTSDNREIDENGDIFKTGKNIFTDKRDLRKVKPAAADWRSERVEALLRARSSNVRLDPEELNDLFSPRGMQRNRYRRNPLVAYGVVIPLEGMLVDTRKIHLRVWRRLAISHNLRFPRPEDVAWAASASPYDFDSFERCAYRIFGVNAIRSYEEKKALHREFTRQIHRELFNVKTNEISLVRHGAEWVENLLTHGVRVSLVTKLPSKIARKLLAEAHLDVDALGEGGLVADDEQTQDSQLYLSASLRMFRPPKKCVVVTDRPGGSAAAHEAGMRALALVKFASKHQSTRLDLRDSDVIVPDYKDFRPYDLTRLTSDVVYDSD